MVIISILEAMAAAMAVIAKFCLALIGLGAVLLVIVIVNEIAWVMRQEEERCLNEKEKY